MKETKLAPLFSKAYYNVCRYFEGGGDEAFVLGYLEAKFLNFGGNGPERGNVYYVQKVMANDLGYDLRRFRRIISNLENAGLILTTRKEGSCNHFTIPPTLDEMKSWKRGEPILTVNECSDVPELGNGRPATIYNNLYRKKREGETPTLLLSNGVRLTLVEVQAQRGRKYTLKVEN